jgi:hypothetical protein
MAKSDKSHGLIVLSWILYGLAAVLLIAAILLGVSVSGAAAVVPAATIGFQAPMFKPVWDALVSGLHLLGVLVFAAGFIAASLAFCIGFLVRRAARLEQRLAALEATLTGRAATESFAVVNKSITAKEDRSYAP